VNIKSDLPTAADAIKRVTFNIHNSRALGYTVLKLIHGYGSTGKGGKIRTETRRYLQQQKAKGAIRNFIPGEEFSIFNEATRAAFAVCDELRRDSDLERANNGVTIVVL
ncbi:MAG: Smr/MutS family protein, partial [Bacillota bacterium]